MTNKAFLYVVPSNLPTAVLLDEDGEILKTRAHNDLDTCIEAFHEHHPEYSVAYNIVEVSPKLLKESIEKGDMSMLPEGFSVILSKSISEK